VDAYFTASFEVARRLADGRGTEAIEILRRELARIEEREDHAGRRFLLSQIALCHARLGQLAEAEQVLNELEEALPADAETALMLAEGYLLLLDNPDRASHHAALAMQWAEEAGEATSKLLSRAHTLMARALLFQGDLLGAFGAWQSCEMPDWRVAVELLDAGYDRDAVRQILADALPRFDEHERQAGSEGSAASDRVRQLIQWIDAGCPRGTANTH
jgi:tetratricopeptide (TPR) repeat protein